MSNKTVTIEGVEVVHDSGKALLVKSDAIEEPVWIPKALIDEDSDVYEAGTSGALIIPEWLAIDKELV